MTSNHLLLYRLAELMLEHEQHILLVDVLFDDEQIGDFVKSIQIDSPYQQMILEGVLTETVRDEMLYVSFTVEGYFHFILGEVIYNRTEGLGAVVLKQLVEGNVLNGVKEGVEQCLIRFSAEKYFQVFGSITKIMDDISFLETPTINLLRSTSGRGLANFFIKHSDNKEVKIFKNSVQKIRDLGYNDYVANCLNELFNEIRGSIKEGEQGVIYLSDFLLSFSSYFSLSELKEIIESVLHFNVDNLKIDKVEFFSNVGFACRLLDRQEESLKFYNYALDENSNDLPGRVKILNRVATLHNEYAIKDRNKDEGDLAIERFEIIVAMLTDVSQFDPLLKATVYNNYAKAQFTFLMYKWDMKYSVSEIEKLQKKSFDIIVKTKGMYSDLAAKILNNQSQFFAMIGDINKSLELCLKGFDVVKRIYSFFSKDTAIFSFNIGNRYEQLTKYIEAKHYYQMTFEINRQLGQLAQSNQMNSAYLRVLFKLNELELAKDVEAQILRNDK
jgi:tetratricopeptide (TPR) repeat protein